MRKLLRIAVTATLLAGLVACGSDSAEPDAPTTDAELLALGKELSQCLRDNGVPEFPDPTVRDGNLVMPQNQPAEAVDNAMKACQTILDRIPRQSGGDSSSAQDVPQLRKFAQCLRENGVPDWPDPKTDGTFPVLGTPLDSKTPELQQARAACRIHWDRGWSVS
jgi:hypothetical protein